MASLLNRKTRRQLAEDCRRTGLAPGDVVMVHASLRAVGDILGGPDVLIDTIGEAIGADGTMMMYVGCQEPFDDVGRKQWPAEETDFVLEHCPVFDPATARAAREFGALAELFRTRPGVKCSANPGARMAALGAKAEWLTEDHPLDYGYGPGSPLAKLCETGGKVLLIGSSADDATVLHYAEHIAPIPDKKVVHIESPLSRDGRRTWVDIEEYDTSIGVVDWPDGFFADIVGRFLGTEHAQTGRIGDAASHLLDAANLVAFAVPLMVDTAEAVRGANAAG